MRGAVSLISCSSPFIAITASSASFSSNRKVSKPLGSRAGGQAAGGRATRWVARQARQAAGWVGRWAAGQAEKQSPVGDEIVRREGR